MQRELFARSGSTELNVPVAKEDLSELTDPQIRANALNLVAGAAMGALLNMPPTRAT